MYTRTNMAGKLYWRIKKNGKWTWKAVFPNGKPDNLTEFLEVIFETEAE